MTLCYGFSFSVFALGSSAYPNFCAFGKSVDHALITLGAEKVYPLDEGDELCGQEQAFQLWSKGVLTVCTKYLPLD